MRPTATVTYQLVAARKAGGGAEERGRGAASGLPLPTVGDSGCLTRPKNRKDPDRGEHCWVRPGTGTQRLERVSEREGGREKQTGGAEASVSQHSKDGWVTYEGRHTSQQGPNEKIFQGPKCWCCHFRGASRPA